MRSRTAVVFGLIVVGLCLVATMVVLDGGSGTLSKDWVSETERPNQANHHPVAVGRAGGDSVIVAPVSAVGTTDAPCRLHALDEHGETQWRHTVADTVCAIHGIGDPTVADYDRDDTAEVLVPTTEEKLYVFNATNGRVEFTHNLSSFGYGRPVVISNPKPLIVAGDFNGTVYGIAANGTTVWQRHRDDAINADPQVRDVDGDGVSEIAVGFNSHVVVYEHDGTTLWRQSVEATWLVSGTVDGDPVLVASGPSDDIVALSHTGQVRWTVSLGDRPALNAVTDGDDDGRAEVYVGSGGNQITAVSLRTGDVEWQTMLTATDSNVFPAPSAGDVDGDGRPEIVAVTGDGLVSVLSAETGAVLSTYERDVAVWTQPTVADYDGDGHAEILVMYGDGRVVSLSHSGPG